jgi:hypothetical protein
VSALHPNHRIVVREVARQRERKAIEFTLEGAG